MARKRRRDDIWLPRQRRRRNRGLLWGLLAVVIVVAGGAVGFALASGDGGSAANSTTTISKTSPTTTTPSSSSPSSSSTGTGTTSTVPHAPPGRPVPILMYHVVEAPPAGAALPELYLPPASFAAQLGWLGHHGYHPVTLGQVWDYWTQNAPLPVKPIVLSFDDGYRSQFTVAARDLHARGWPGVLNLIVGHLHEGTYGLGPHQVQQMIAWGWEIDSHTLTHPDLTTVHGADLTAEVSGSRTQLQQLFNVPVNFFCYPAGAYNAEVIAAVRKAGYDAATTTNEGLADLSQGRFTLDRVRINGSTTVDQFAALLGGS